MVARIGRAQLRKFVTLVEDSVSPRDVGRLYARAEALARLPISLQRWIVQRAGGDPYMGFVVEPYCLFLAYEVTDRDAAARLLPPGYRLIPSAMFEGDQPRYVAILGAFTVHTTVFWGARVELYLVAESETTGMLTWIICDYESDTINYDPGQGFSGATTSRAIVTTTHTGDVLVDVRSAHRPNELAVSAPTAGGTQRPLEQRLWVEGNLSVDYGGRLAHPGSESFGLIFDPGEMTQALDIPVDAVEVERNTFGADFRATEPLSVACFPYAQHFLTTSYPRHSPIHDRAGLEYEIEDRLHAARRSAT
jgi:hypothetical protein